MEALRGAVSACLASIAPDEAPPSHPAPLNVEKALPKIVDQSSYEKPLETPPLAPASMRMMARAGFATKRSIARNVYRPTLEAGRNLMEHVGAIARKYVLAR